ncbi:MAG: hypothetical protein UY47_C0004G0025 [Parcubacteria group bacterium GW2011_GWB1_49_7]|nr:MAG: hypothetical protein UY47_C0004G0025 [Parcubacteria group bacterium GW2011_GWB1_49_7]
MFDEPREVVAATRGNGVEREHLGPDVASVAHENANGLDLPVDADDVDGADPADRRAVQTASMIRKQIFFIGISPVQGKLPVAGPELSFFILAYFSLFVNASHCFRFARALCEQAPIFPRCLKSSTFVGYKKNGSSEPFFSIRIYS